MHPIQYIPYGNQRINACTAGIYYREEKFAMWYVTSAQDFGLHFALLEMKLHNIMYNSGSNETGGVEVDSEVQSRTNAGAAVSFAVLGWLAVLGGLVVYALLWYWNRKRIQRKYKL